MAVITFSRQLGSRGDAIATAVCEQLGYRYFDKKMMVEAAAEVGLSEQEVVDFSEDHYEVRSFLSRLLRAEPRPIDTATARRMESVGRTPLTARGLDDAQCIELVRYTILSAYNIGNIVVVGRGGQAILQGKPGTLHVRVIAPLDARIQAMQAQGRTGIAEIKLKLHQADQSTAAYLKRFYELDVDDPTHYHLVINTGRISESAAIASVMAAARALEAAPAAI